MIAGVELSDEQERARELVLRRLDRGEGETRIGGVAGSGKTTLLGTIADDLGDRARHRHRDYYYRCQICNACERRLR